MSSSLLSAAEISNNPDELYKRLTHEIKFQHNGDGEIVVRYNYRSLQNPRYVHLRQQLLNFIYTGVVSLHFSPAQMLDPVVERAAPVKVLQTKLTVDVIRQVVRYINAHAVASCNRGGTDYQCWRKITETDHLNLVNEYNAIVLQYTGNMIPVPEPNLTALADQYLVDRILEEKPSELANENTGLPGNTAGGYKQGAYD